MLEMILKIIKTLDRTEYLSPTLKRPVQSSGRGEFSRRWESEFQTNTLKKFMKGKKEEN